MQSESESEVAQSCPTLCDPMDCSLPGSSFLGIFQARILEWVAISFSRDLPNPGIEPGSPALQADALPSEPPGKPFHAKMGSIKDRNSMDLTEAEDTKKRWQEYTEELFKKDLNDPDNHDGMITHLEPDILECEVKWALGSITTKKASGGDGIPVELFQILKVVAEKVLHSICQQIWKTQQWLQDWKRSVFIPIPMLDNAKECSNYCTIALLSHASKVMPKILQARLQQHMN